MKRHLEIVTAVFIFALLVSNLLSSAKLISVFDYTVDAGIILFPVAYIIGDILVDVYGYKASRRVIWTGFILSVCFAFILWFVSILPGDTWWGEAVGQSAYDMILGGIYGLIPASIAGYLLGEFTNARTLVFFKERGSTRAGYYIYSTLFGEAVDTGVFFIVATFLGVFPPELFVELFLLNYVIKVAFEVLCVPVTSFIARKLDNVSTI